MKVRIINSESWHRGLVGQVFNVKPYGTHPVRPGHVLVDSPASRYHEYGLYGTDYEVVAEVPPAPLTKIVEHEGVKYEVPSWATSLSRDSAGRQVFFWEHAPTWTTSNGYYHTCGAASSRNGAANEYVPPVPPKPEGSFMVTI